MESAKQKKFLSEYFKMCRDLKMRFEVENGKIVLVDLEEGENVPEIPSKQKKEVKEIKDTRKKYRFYKPDEKEEQKVEEKIDISRIFLTKKQNEK